MLSFGTGVRIFVGIEPVDMRGSFDALAGCVRRLGLDPTNGHLYLFFNRRRRLCKMLFFDGSGFCLFSKRLERGTFELPSVPEGEDRVVVDSALLSSLLSGIELGAKRRSWYRGKNAA
ncbi:MAG: IS66 family insertion sequence element accessory protein TnpB [Deltaproteobacteria bacterium]|nr:IS66 family insertion sequence element accessory protein TnpB [Deltaproteobacteria bacterium]